jgi:hypothetical protein
MYECNYVRNCKTNEKEYLYEIVNKYSILYSIKIKIRGSLQILHCFCIENLETNLIF